MNGELGNEYYDRNIGYRKLMGAMLESAIRNAMGVELSAETNSYKKCRHDVKQNAIAYILSEAFAEDMEAFGMDECAVERVRVMVTQDTHQMPLRNPTYKLQPAQREEIRQIGREAQEKGERLNVAEIARKYGIHPTSARDLVRA